MTRESSKMQGGRYSPLFYLVVLVAALGGILYGYDLSVAGPAVTTAEKGLLHGASALYQGLVVGTIFAGSLIGSLVAGTTTGAFGRRKTIMLAAVLYILGAAVAAFAPVLWVLIIGRFILGLGLGFSMIACPLYLSEVAPARSRGRLIATYQVALTLGIVLGYVINLALQGLGGNLIWRVAFGLAAAPALAQFFGMLFLPESPRWLFQHQDEARAHLVLERIQGGDVEEEIDGIKASLVSVGNRSWRGLVDTLFSRRTLMIGLVIAAINPLTGVNVVISYAPKIFATLGLTTTTATLIGGIGFTSVNLIAGFLGYRFVDRWGRRQLGMVGLTGIIVSSVVTGIVVITGISGTLGLVIGMVAIFSFIIFYAASVGVTVWVIINEIFPLRVRGKGVGLSLALNNVLNFILTTFLLSLMSTVLGMSLAFFIFAGFTFCGLMFVVFRVPETKGLTLEEIEAKITSVYEGKDPKEDASAAA